MGVSDSWWTRGDSVPDHYVVSIEPTPSSRRQSSPHLGDEFDCSNLPGIELRGTPKWVYPLIGGPEEIRTPDPYNANVMRSQLRYGPVSILFFNIQFNKMQTRCMALAPHPLFLCARTCPLALPAALRAQVVVPQARKILYVFFASVSRDFLKIGGKSAGLIIGGSRNDQAGRNGGGGVSRLPPRRSGGSPPFRRGCFCIRRRPPAPG